MTLCRVQLFRRLVVTVVYTCLYAHHSSAAPTTRTTLSVCDYTLKNLYIVNTTATSIQFPTGYMSCVNAGGSDARLCGICSCRENKVGLAAGGIVAGVVCVGSGNATTCAGHDQEYCDCKDSAGCAVNATFLRDGSSDTNDVVADDMVSGSSSVSVAAESNSTSTFTSNSTVEPATNVTLPTVDTSSSLESSISIESNSPVSENLDTQMDTATSIPSISPESVYYGNDTDSGNSAIDDDTINADSVLRSMDSTSDTGGSSTNSTSESSSSSMDFAAKETRSVVVNDNVINDVAGDAKSIQTDAAPLTDPNVIHTQDNGSMLGTNSGSSTKSIWSGERLTTMLAAMCGIGVVAAIAAFVAMRRGQPKMDKELGTPMDDYVDDGTSMVTPANCGTRYHGEGKHNVDSFENTPLASIAVIGSNDAFLTSPSSASKHQYRSYPGAGRTASGDSYARTDSPLAGKDGMMRDSLPSSASIQQQFLLSHGPSVSHLQSPTSNAIFDTSNTHESFSSGMSSQSKTPLHERVCESKKSFNSFRMAFEASCRTDCDSDTSKCFSDCQALSASNSEEIAAVSSPCSLESVQYNTRDTEASEHMHEWEMNTSSSRIAFSFDMDSI